MKLSSFLIAICCTAFAVVVLMVGLGVKFHRPVQAVGASLYDPAHEVTLQGTVEDLRDFSCPVSEGEVGGHLLLKTSTGIVQVHLAPGRILRSHHITFSPGEPVTVTGSQIRMMGSVDVIAREIDRGNEQLILRDSAGKLMLVQ